MSIIPVRKVPWVFFLFGVYLSLFKNLAGWAGLCSFLSLGPCGRADPLESLRQRCKRRRPPLRGGAASQRRRLQRQQELFHGQAPFTAARTLICFYTLSPPSTPWCPLSPRPKSRRAAPRWHRWSWSDWCASFWRSVWMWEPWWARHGWLLTTSTSCHCGSPAGSRQAQRAGSAAAPWDQVTGAHGTLNARLQNVCEWCWSAAGGFPC